MRRYLCTTDPDDVESINEIEATSDRDAAEIFACADDPECSDGSSWDVLVRKPDETEWTVFRVTTRIEVSYDARRTGVRPVTP